MEYLTEYTELKIMIERQQDEYQKIKNEQQNLEDKIKNTINLLTRIVSDIENIVDVAKEDLEVLLSFDSDLEKYINQLQFLRQNLGKEKEKQIPQYQSIIKQLRNKIEDILERQNQQLIAIQHDHSAIQETDIKEYSKLTSKIGVEGPIDKIDDEKEVELLNQLLKTAHLSPKQKISILKKIILNNANCYSEELIKQNQLESSSLTKENASLQEETPILDSEVSETIENLLSQEDQDLINHVEKILGEQEENITGMNTSNQEGYESYYQEFYIQYFSSYLNDIHDALTEWMNSTDLEDRKIYQDLLQDFLQELRTIYQSYQSYQSYQPVQPPKPNTEESTIYEPDAPFHNQGKNVLFLLDENQNSYLLQDIEKEDSGNIETIKKTITNMIASLRKGNVAPIKKNHSNEFYENYRIELFRKFTDLGLQELAFYNLTNDTILLIGTDITSKSETLGSKSIDRTIASRVQDKRYLDTIQQYQQILKNGDKEKLIIEHNGFLQELAQAKKAGVEK